MQEGKCSFGRLSAVGANKAAGGFGGRCKPPPPMAFGAKRQENFKISLSNTPNSSILHHFRYCPYIFFVHIEHFSSCRVNCCSFCLCLPKHSDFLVNEAQLSPLRGTVLESIISPPIVTTENNFCNKKSK